MKLYKVFSKGLISPFQNMKYKKGEWYTCENFDEDKENSCSYGFYATDIEGITYSISSDKDIYEVEVKGKSVECDPYKRRYEKIKIIRKCSKKEILSEAIEAEEKLGYKLSEAIFPIHPLHGNPRKPQKQDINNLILWASVSDSVGASVWASVSDSVGASVWDSVSDSVGASVWDSVRASVVASVGASVGDSVVASVGDSVWDSVWDSVSDSVGASVVASVRASVGASVGDSVWDSVVAYMSGLFPNIDEWKYIKHEKGINPFKPCIDLWYRGFIPSFDGTTWRLHSGKYGATVFEIKKSDII